MTRKYEITDEKTTLYRVLQPVQVYRIRALKDFGDVKKGDLGGYVLCEDNLSQEGDCWIDYTSAVVGRNAWIADNAQIKENSWLCESAVAKNNAVIEGHCTVGGYCVVRDNANISNYAHLNGSITVADNAMIEGEVDLKGDFVLAGDTNLITHSTFNSIKAE